MPLGQETLTVSFNYSAQNIFRKRKKGKSPKFFQNLMKNFLRRLAAKHMKSLWSVKTEVPQPQFQAKQFTLRFDRVT